MSRTPLDLHRAELNRLLTFLTSFLILSGGSYFVPGLGLIQPWLPGEPIPLVSIITNPDSLHNPGDMDSLNEPTDYSEAVDEELEAEEADLYAELASASSPNAQPLVDQAQVDALVSMAEANPEIEIPEMEILAAQALASDHAPSISLHREIAFDRGPTRNTPLELQGEAMDQWFAALARVQSGEPGAKARVLHYGDSTIAGDGIARTIRRRLQTRFGDGGPGFLAVHVDRRWAARPGIGRWPKGDWRTRTITHGGQTVPHYGLAGTVSTTSGTASSVMGGQKIDGERQPLHRFELYYQSQPGGGTILLQPKEGETVSIPTDSAELSDAYYPLEIPDGTSSLTVRGNGDGPITIYGLAMETDMPGVTWETMGVAGASNKSMFRQDRDHFIQQVQHRNPDLIIYQMGGNELGYPSLKRSGGKDYKATYIRVIKRLKEAAPNASCLIISPLDQAEKFRGRVRSKEMVSRMVQLQREAADEQGCAFWSAWDAMGGEGSFARWMDMNLAGSDLYHLTNRGLNHVGHALSDAMEDSYGNWLLSQLGKAPLPQLAAVLPVPIDPDSPSTTSVLPVETISKTGVVQKVDESANNETNPSDPQDIESDNAAATTLKVSIESESDSAPIDESTGTEKSVVSSLDIEPSPSSQSSVPSTDSLNPNAVEVTSISKETLRNETNTATDDQTDDEKDTNLSSGLSTAESNEAVPLQSTNKTEQDEPPSADPVFVEEDIAPVIGPKQESEPNTEPMTNKEALDPIEETETEPVPDAPPVSPAQTESPIPLSIDEGEPTATSTAPESANGASSLSAINP